MPKKKRPFIFTTARIRLVQSMQAHRQSVEEIADALGCSVETVTDFLLSQVDGTGPGVVSNQLFRMATSQWEAFDPAMPRFDVGKLVEKANEPKEEGE